MFRSTEFELETELLDNQPQDTLQSQGESEFEGGGAGPTPPRRRARLFTCSNTERASVVGFLGTPVTVQALRAAVEAAAGRAVVLASSSAAALEISPRTPSTRRLFCEAFGVFPEFVPPWRATLKGVVRWRDLGELVAIRLRRAARILDGGFIRYFCWGSQAHCPECPGDPATYFACSSFLGSYLICLGGLFWRAWQAGDTATTASTLLHEALHIFFSRTVSDVGRSGNANCYERFVVRFNGLALHPATAANCAAGACPPRRPAAVLDRFGFDQSSLVAAHAPLIQRLARHIVASWRTPRPIRVVRLVGYADSRGSASYNDALGARRATSVRGALLSTIMKMGGPARHTKFFVRSRGARQPVAPSSTAEGRARNRRVAVNFVRDRSCDEACRQEFLECVAENPKNRKLCENKLRTCLRICAGPPLF